MNNTLCWDICHKWCCEAMQLSEFLYQQIAQMLERELRNYEGQCNTWNSMLSALSHFWNRDQKQIWKCTKGRNGLMFRVKHVATLRDLWCNMYSMRSLHEDKKNTNKRQTCPCPNFRWRMTPTATPSEEEQYEILFCLELRALYSPTTHPYIDSLTKAARGCLLSLAFAPNAAVLAPAGRHIRCGWKIKIHEMEVSSAG